MNFSNSTKLLSRSLIGAIGLSAIALLASSQATKAADINAGIDFLFTPANSDSFVDFDANGSLNRVFFKGIPILPGGTDTAVERLNECDFDAMGKCTVDLQMESLNLMSRGLDQEQQDFFGTDVIFLTLDDSQGNQPITSMTLMDNEDGTASWTNTLDFFWKLTDSQDNVLATGRQFFEGDGIGQIDGNGDFTVLTYDDREALARHTDKKVPEPSTVLMSVSGLAVILRLKKKKESNS